MHLGTGIQPPGMLAVSSGAHAHASKAVLLMDRLASCASQCILNQLPELSQNQLSQECYKSAAPHLLLASILQGSHFWAVHVHNVLQQASDRQEAGPDHGSCYTLIFSVAGLKAEEPSAAHLRHVAAQQGAGEGNVDGCLLHSELPVSLICGKPGQAWQTRLLSMPLPASQRAATPGVDIGACISCAATVRLSQLLPLMRHLLVASEDPDGDACQGKLLDGLRHAQLQLVLDGRAAQEHQVALDALRHLGHLGIAPLDGRLCLHESLLPPGRQQQMTRSRFQLACAVQPGGQCMAAALHPEP